MSVHEINQNLIRATDAAEDAVAMQNMMASNLSTIAENAAMLRAQVQEFLGFTGGFVEKCGPNIRGQGIAIGHLQLAVDALAATAEGSDTLDEPLKLLEGTVESSMATLTQTANLRPVMLQIHTEVAQLEQNLGNVAETMGGLSKDIYERIGDTVHARNAVNEYRQAL